MKKKRIIALLLYSLLNFVAFVPLAIAQVVEDPTVEMADQMRSEGKIYVVILIVAIVFTGLTIYAINTDRKLTRLEKEIGDLKSDKDS